MHLRFFDAALLVLLRQMALVEMEGLELRLHLLELEFPPRGVRRHRRREELFVRM